MTIKILEDQSTFTYAIDTPNILTNVQLEVTSLYSNTILFDLSSTLLESNNRYSRFECNVPADFWDKHYNGLYTYRIYEGETTWDTGSFKLITKPGGDTGTESHTSNNENRQAKVIYRPSYE